MYFKAITGLTHNHFGPMFQYYPYPVIDSGLNVLHFSDVRPHERRLDRMRITRLNNGCDEAEALKQALVHPRVTLKGDKEFKFAPAQYPEYMQKEIKRCPA